MVKNFKFFHGVIRSSLTATWTHQEGELFGIDAEEELTRLMSNEIAREIDNNIIEELTRRINGGNPSIFGGPIIGFNNNVA
jgi:hypothetical protein